MDLIPSVFASDSVIKHSMAAVPVVSYFDHLDGFALLEPTLDAVRVYNPMFWYCLETSSVYDTLMRVTIIMPHAVETFPYNFKVIGIDGAHCGQVVVQLSPRALLKQNTLIMITSRTPNNEMTILAFSLVYSENAVDISHLLQSCLDHGLPLNEPDITSITDR
jgi:hypothetical protein